MASDEYRRFAAERSHHDATAANDQIRLLDQYIVVINGASATAILAFLAKESILRPNLKLVVASLVCFAVGAGLGTAAMRAHSTALDHWHDVWRLRAELSADGEQRTACEAKREADAAACCHNWCYGLSIGSYVLGCMLFGLAAFWVGGSAR